MVLKKIKEHQSILRKEIKEKTIGYILAAFGLVAGLAWNEAIKSFIDQFFPNSGNGVLIKFVYALAITIIVVVITVYLLKLTKKDN
ncbi:MAG: hypothetical protein A3C58_03700 [Candidatus Staskawiczbacteria bacterium RIFCSPHIGHO2_02_FULL_34_10]|uniref:Uncharacterized protein n=1 Tax=Candidatus Staskawiczbacteria bacterium RIFCSPHIGHO2_02_FULL_34_10 TaxID=1802205 RepID=A0A1G2HXT1_9BACT|nr:MAG: hypothetical protein A3C58_03700 [Candidatus Staskawiczbacteria bacterium RIFCSPHIGHO2_02_FULL_34_10]